jgi:YggT family protein
MFRPVRLGGLSLDLGFIVLAIAVSIAMVIVRNLA